MMDGNFRVKTFAFGSSGLEAQKNSLVFQLPADELTKMTIKVLEYRGQENLK